MSDLRTAARAALWAFQCHVEQTWPTDRSTAAIAALRAALAQEQAEATVKESLQVAPAQEQAEPKGGGNLPPPLQAEPVQEPDLSRCPQCNGPADNGHDRSLPPNPYLCTKCMAEMPQPSYNVTVVDDAHPNGIPLEQWVRSGNPPQRKPLTEEEIRRICDAHWSLRQLARGIERAHGIGEQP